MAQITGRVQAVCRNTEPGIPKHKAETIQLVVDQGVKGDYHFGMHVRHRYLVKKDPGRLNNRQVLLVDTGMLEDLRSRGIELKPGQMGENLVLDGIDIMSLSIGTRLQIGETLLELTEVREPCAQLNESHPDLLEAVRKESSGQPIYKAGMFASIHTGGKVQAGDAVRVVV